jgi:hypothetical protein
MGQELYTHSNVIINTKVYSQIQFHIDNYKQ